MTPTIRLLNGAPSPSLFVRIIFRLIVNYDYLPIRKIIKIDLRDFPPTTYIHARFSKAWLVLLQRSYSLYHLGARPGLNRESLRIFTRTFSSFVHHQELMSRLIAV